MDPIDFVIDPSRRTGLLQGLDEIEQSLLHAGAIASRQARDWTDRPWMWASVRNTQGEPPC